jgi:predicted transcriptional regulator
MSKNYCKTEDASTNATGASVPGTGDDVADFKKKKKKKNPWDKYSPDALGKQFGGQAYRAMKMESAVAVEPNTTPDDTFAGVDVFNVNDDDFNNCKFGKKKHARWEKYVDVESETGKRIYGYAQKNPKKSIIVQHDKTGHMLYLKKYDMGGES